MLAEQFLEFCSVLNNNYETVQKALRPAAVDGLLGQTETVDIYDGTMTTFVVTMNRGGKVRELDFSVEGCTRFVCHFVSRAPGFPEFQLHKLLTY